MHRAWIIGLAAILGTLQGHLAFAMVAEPAQAQVERGYAFLAQAHLESESTARDRLLTAATAAFKAAYQSEPVAPAMQVQALLGASQASLFVQSPRRAFPFLWQATPLQRAEKNLQQALVLQPDNAAAVFLLGLVYWRQATQAAGQQHDVLARSRAYLTQAAALGVPIQVSSRPVRSDTPLTWFNVEDTVVALRYVDARGVGRMDDLIFIYRSAARQALFGVAIAGRQGYPLATDSATGTLALQGLPESISTVPQPGKAPLLVLRLRQGTQVIDTRFTWDGAGFVAPSALP